MLLTNYVICEIIIIQSISAIYSDILKSCQMLRMFFCRRVISLQDRKRINRKYGTACGNFSSSSEKLSANGLPAVRFIEFIVAFVISRFIDSVATLKTLLSIIPAVVLFAWSQSNMLWSNVDRSYYQLRKSLIQFCFTMHHTMATWKLSIIQILEHCWWYNILFFLVSFSRINFVNNNVIESIE